MKTSTKLVPTIAAVLAAMLLPSVAHACSVCMGASDSTVVPAANAAIFSMFGVVGAVLSGVAGFIIHLVRLSKRQ